MTYDGTCNIILYSSSHICSKLDSSRAGPVRGKGDIDTDYRAETEQLLTELEKRLATCGSNKDLLVKVVVTVTCMCFIACRCSMMPHDEAEH